MVLSNAIDSPGDASLGCDSLELLWLTAAVNEMFHLHEAGCESDLLGAKTFGQWIDGVEAAWQRGVATITFSTSGSTGVPKRCPQTFSHLQLETAFLAELFSSSRRVVCLTPGHHIYGFLFGAMLADAVGGLNPSACGSLELLTRMFHPGDLVVSSPAYWHWLNRTISRWPEEIEGVTSTGPCSPMLIESLVANGLSGMTEIYGSTETGGVGFRKWPAERFHFMPHWSSKVREGPNDPLQLISTLGRRISLMDDLQMDEEGAFVVVGRRDDAVQVGGTNVFPVRIAALLGSQPGVKSAAVRPMRATEGDRLKAFIVPEEGEDEEALLQALQRWSAENLSVAERPAAIRFGTIVPLNELGKSTDW
jgi:long-chain acyl-CoA synthetase